MGASAPKEKLMNRSTFITCPSPRRTKGDVLARHLRRATFLLLLVVGTSPAFAATFKPIICNQTDKLLYYAVVSSQHSLLGIPTGQYRSKGWWEIPPGECVNVDGKHEGNAVVYVGIVSSSGGKGPPQVLQTDAGETGSVRNTNKCFCVDPEDPFVRRGGLYDLDVYSQDECPRGWFKFPFQIVFRGRGPGSNLTSRFTITHAYPAQPMPTKQELAGRRDEDDAEKTLAEKAAPQWFVEKKQGWTTLVRSLEVGIRQILQELPNDFVALRSGEPTPETRYSMLDGITWASSLSLGEFPPYEPVKRVAYDRAEDGGAQATFFLGLSAPSELSDEWMEDDPEELESMAFMGYLLRNPYADLTNLEEMVEGILGEGWNRTKNEVDRTTWERTAGEGETWQLMIQADYRGLQFGFGRIISGHDTDR